MVISYRHGAKPKTFFLWRSSGGEWAVWGSLPPPPPPLLRWNPAGGVEIIIHTIHIIASPKEKSTSSAPLVEEVWLLSSLVPRQGYSCWAINSFLPKTAEAHLRMRPNFYSATLQNFSRWRPRYRWDSRVTLGSYWSLIALPVLFLLPLLSRSIPFASSCVFEGGLSQNKLSVIVTLIKRGEGGGCWVTIKAHQ